MPATATPARTLLTLLALGTSLSARADVITLAADVWCPYNCEPKAEKQGYLIEIAKEIFGKKGHTVEYVIVPWTRAIVDSRKGLLTGIIGAAVEDAPDFIFPAASGGLNKACFYVKPDSTWKYESAQSLPKVSVGVVRSYTYGEPLDEYIKANENNADRISFAAGESPLELNLRKLLGGRLGALVENENVFNWYSRNEKNPPKVKTAGCLKGNGVNIAFSPKHPKAKEYAQELSAGYDSLRKSGKLREILGRYGVADWK